MPTNETIANPTSPPAAVPETAPGASPGAAPKAAKKGVAMDPSWQACAEAEFAKEYMQELRVWLAGRKARRAVIYPHSRDWFRAFELTAVQDVRVVILGQDPYHGAGQAQGLSFSVPDGVAPPPSLRNIFKEIDADLAGGEPRLQRTGKGSLVGWARQGVFLLNSVLTVEHGQAAAHQGRGWETFTDAVVEHLSEHGQPMVFLLWGSYAQKKGQIIDASRHLVLRSPHPSPLSARRGFFGCRHFSATNAWLEEQGRGRIDWYATTEESR